MTPPDSRPILLVAERRDLAADLVVAELVKKGAAFVRWNCEDFPLSSTMIWEPTERNAKLHLGSQRFSLEQFKSAWYRRTPAPILDGSVPVGAPGFVEREISTFLAGVWAYSRLRWINWPPSVLRAENKLLQLALAQELGFSTPRTIVTNDPSAARSFVAAVPRAVVKSITGGTFEQKDEWWVLLTHPVSAGDLESDTAIQIAPCIFQERIEKWADIRVTLVGTDIYAAQIVTTVGDEVDWRALDRSNLSYRPHTLPDELASRCLEMLRRFGLTYGCFDFVLTPGGDYFFLEVNPSGQWGWVEHELGFRITESITRWLIEAKS